MSRMPRSFRHLAGALCLVAFFVAPVAQSSPVLQGPTWWGEELLSWFARLWTESTSLAEGVGGLAHPGQASAASTVATPGEGPVETDDRWHIDPDG